MKRKLILGLVALCALALPAAGLAGPSGQDKTNAARACASLRTSVGLATFRSTYGANASFGSCVSTWLSTATTTRVAAQRACKTKHLKGKALRSCVATTTTKTLRSSVASTANAAKACAAERTSIGDEAFAVRYGTNGNDANAFGKCVSQHAKAKHGGTATTTKYHVTLAPLNNSGVKGFVTLTLRGDQLTVKVQARNLVPGQQHMQHIHGLVSGTATCPTPAADTDHDGIVSLAEGLPFYGAVLQPLTPYPNANAGGNVSYSETLTVNTSTLGALETRTVVLHGLTVAGTYDMTVPVACGQIVKG